jgi:hypothetical protein
MESSTIMDEPSPRRARFTEKLAAVMTEPAPAHLLRLARGVRLLPKNPPPHAVSLAVVTATVLGAATGIVLAFTAPAPEANGAPTAIVTAARRSRSAEEAASPRLLALRRPQPRLANTRAVVEATAGVVPPAPPAPPSPPTPASSPAPAMQILTASGPAPHATVTRTPAARTPLAHASVVASPVSARDAIPPLGAPARPGEPSTERTADDSGAADELIWLAERAFQSGHPAEAVRLGKKALAVHAGARAHLALAAAYFDLRRFDDARASYEAVLQTEPGNQAARIGLDLAKTAQARPPEPQP